ncbi:unnamed protein product [Peronospora destructor]|uniref:FYVE-type domain-containing protein n=1 Tax=Peronospora destructor TaxID=86335 RepID=A0AAV0V7N5_9STRA|nr:unnamed protein product [Peronospora destructor]
MQFAHSWDAGHLFPPRELVLTCTDTEQFEAIGDQLVAETLQASEDFIADGRSVDLDRWKIVMEKGCMTAYRSRSRGQRRGQQDTEEAVESPFVHRPKVYSTDSSLSDLMGRSNGSSLENVHCNEDSRIDSESREQSVLGKSRLTNTPIFFGGGVISGSVDDAGLGFLANTKDRSIMRAATSMDVKLKDKIDEVPEFRKNGLVRLRMSSCHIMRPYHNQGELEVYFRGYCNPTDYFSIGASTHFFCQTLLDTVQVVEESYLMKLAWFVHAYPQRRNSHENDEKREGCACCHKFPNIGFKKLLESSKTCFLCRRKVCKKCIIKKHLHIDLTSRKQSLEFCLTCYLKAKKLSAWRVAVATLPRS